MKMNGPSNPTAGSSRDQAVKLGVRFRYLEALFNVVIDSTRVVLIADVTWAG